VCHPLELAHAVAGLTTTICHCHWYLLQSKPQSSENKATSANIMTMIIITTNQK